MKIKCKTKNFNIFKNGMPWDKMKFKLKSICETLIILIQYIGQNYKTYDNP